MTIRQLENLKVGDLVKFKPDGDIGVLLYFSQQLPAIYKDESDTLAYFYWMKEKRVCYISRSIKTMLENSVLLRKI